MKPLEVITYKGKQVVVIDISYTSPEQAIEYFKVAQPQIAKFPPKSVLALTDATDARFNQDSTNAIKEFAAKNTPNIKASATVGSEGLRKIVLMAVERTASRNIMPFETREEALEWLVSRE